MDPILGQIILWPLNWVPDGWLACEGQELQIQQYNALYSLLGQTYGGNGATTFKLPDLRNRIPFGAQLPTQVGTVSGAATSSMTGTGTGSLMLQPTQIPSHIHTAAFVSTTASSAPVSVAIPADANNTSDSNAPSVTEVLGKGAVGSNPAKIYSSSAATTTLKPFDATATLPTVTGNIVVGPSLSTAQQPVNVAVAVPVAMSTAQPSLTLRFIIATVGTYPMRP